jgi:hypothetical protein
MVLNEVDSGGEEQEDGTSNSCGSSDESTSPAIAQMDPLELRFSQKKMRNVFANGKLISETVPFVRAVRRPPEEVEIYGAQWHLEAPFPPIEVIRWRCKLRNEATGRPLVDPETGEQMFEPEESWFSLDNRRLFCLQQAALALLPERCTADSTIEIRKDRRLREIRKFRTLDNGKSINVGSVVDGVPFETWCWRSSTRQNGGKSRGKGGKGKGGGYSNHDSAPNKNYKGGGKGKGGTRHKGGKDLVNDTSADPHNPNGGGGKNGREGKGSKGGGKNGKSFRKGGRKGGEAGKSSDISSSV